ncbi:MAG: BrnT family toxin [Acidobacteriota bacterium]|nr:BrnT family toxin [Blastocatellia bacterium]MDQ3221464.1 BrnT family toxin [Acidobacteriota bacterium]MDQ3491621.1 BrnT family toxin [Acidobacteriota bacterium]
MLRFEWDERKRFSNLRKHDIDFADVFRVFDTEMLTKVDDRFDYGEIRHLSLGILFGAVVAISYVDNDDSVRIISARRAEKHEQENYFREIRD